MLWEVRTVFRGEHEQHGLPNQFLDGIAVHASESGVDLQEGIGFRVCQGEAPVGVLKNVLPLTLSFFSRTLALGPFLLDLANVFITVVDVRRYTRCNGVVERETDGHCFSARE